MEKGSCVFLQPEEIRDPSEVWTQGNISSYLEEEVKEGGGQKRRRRRGDIFFLYSEAERFCILISFVSVNLFIYICLYLAWVPHMWIPMGSYVLMQVGLKGCKSLLSGCSLSLAITQTCCRFAVDLPVSVYIYGRFPLIPLHLCFPGKKD